MRKIAIALSALALLGACGKGTATAAKPTMMKKSLTLAISDEKASVFEMVDNGKKGFGPGDQLVELAPVLDAAGAQGGSSYTTLAVVTGTSDKDFSALLDCSVILKDGNILFHGSVDAKNFGTGVDVPVVGGTGAYKGATGQVKVTSVEDGKKTTLVFDLALPV